MKRVSRSILRAIAANPHTQGLLLGLSTHKLLPKMVWKRLPVEHIFEITLPNHITFQYLGSYRDTTARELFWRGLRDYEPETMRVFCDLIQNATNFVDVGAHVGIYTLAACAVNSQCRVVCFEPNSDTRKTLINNIQLNGWAERCEVRAEAVSNQVGKTNFHMPIAYQSSSASLNPQGFRNLPGTLVEVEVITLDHLWQQPLELIKIDVEGFEDSVLEGMQQILKKWRPTIIVECNADGPYARVEAILQSHGYHFFHLLKNGPLAVAHIQPDPNGKYRNFLCQVS